MTELTEFQRGIDCLSPTLQISVRLLKSPTLPPSHAIYTMLKHVLVCVQQQPNDDELCRKVLDLLDSLSATQSSNKLLLQVLAVIFFIEFQ